MKFFGLILFFSILLRSRKEGNGVKRERESLPFGVPRFLKPALIPTRVLRSRARGETRVDIRDEMEDCGKTGGRRRKAKNRAAAVCKPSPKIRGTVLAMSTCWVEHRLFTKGVVESLGTKESFRSTRLELLYLSLDSVAIRARVTIDLDTQ